MRIRPFIPDTDFEILRSWTGNERAHAMWCANRFAYPLSRENFEQVLHDFSVSSGDSPFVATEDDGKLTGFFCYSVNPASSEGFLKFVIVDPARRGIGLGKAMIRLAVDYAYRITNAVAVQLHVFPENTSALKCYESIGFSARKTDLDAFHFRNESWGRCNMIIRKEQREPKSVGRWTIRYNEMTAQQFIDLWNSVWDSPPSLQQTSLALEHSVFRISIFDGDKIVAMARMIGDLGLCYYIKDVIVRPEYQHLGIGTLIIEELLSFVRENGIRDTSVFIELTAMPDKISFYERFDFAANEAKRLKRMYPID